MIKLNKFIIIKSLLIMSAFCSLTACQPFVSSKPATGFSKVSSNTNLINDEAASIMNDNASTSNDTESSYLSNNNSDINNENYYGNVFFVNNIEDLINSVSAAALIIVEPGCYYISDYIDKALSESSLENFNASHEYVQIYGDNNGYQIKILNCPDLYIHGDSELSSEIEISSESDSSCLLIFENCENLELKNLKIYHYKNPENSGSIISFINCNNLNLYNMELSASNANGITITNSGNILIKDSYIHNCQSASICLFNITDSFCLSQSTLEKNQNILNINECQDNSITIENCLIDQAEYENLIASSTSETFDSSEASETSETPEASCTSEESDSSKTNEINNYNYYNINLINNQTFISETEISE